MKKFLLLAALGVASLQLNAATVDLATAQQSAQRFLVSQTAKGRLMASAPTIKWTHEVKTSSNAAQAAYYIVNTDRGYVIVSGDDRAREILAYGDGQLDNLNDLPEAMQLFLNMYQKQMEYLQTHPGQMVSKAANRGGISVEPLLTTEWSQGKPYNLKTPKVGYGSDPYCKVGCSAVALAQVMRYWEYPKVSPALPGYTTTTNHYVLDALPEYTFDWANMLNYYKSSTDQYTQAQLDAVSWFMRYVGQAETMDYTTGQSGAEREQIMQALGIFGYVDAHVIEKWDFEDGTVNYTEEQWGELIQSELAAGRPLIYCAFDMSSDSTAVGGHAFNVDGYDATNDMYHVNFGMSREKNAYYALNAFTLDNGMTIYDFYPILFADVQDPTLSTDPRIMVDTQALAMECYTGETATDTITVKGQYLTQGINVALNDENGVFSINVTSIALDQAGNAAIVVTYAPQAAGTHHATITLSSEGATDRVVTLTGTATVAPLVVYDPVMLPADESKITATSFRADWTDQTAAQNVLSYTLEVNEKPVYNYLAAADWSNTIEVFANQADSWATSGLIPDGWTFSGSNLWAEDHFISLQSATLSTPEFTGCDKVTVVFNAKSLYGSTSVTVATSQASQTIALPGSFTQSVVVLDCAQADQVTFTAGSSYVGMLDVTVYAGEVSAPQLRATEQGDASSRTITGITDKFYTVSGLNAEGTYDYRVKALYADGTESAWSNQQTVTLVGSAVLKGDVDGDGSVGIADVTILIDYLLAGGTINEAAADMDDSGTISISDVTALIDQLLSGN